MPGILGMPELADRQNRIFDARKDQREKASKIISDRMKTLEGNQNV